VQVRPPAAAAFFAQKAQALAGADPHARPDRVVDAEEVAVAIVPTLGVEHVDHVVSRRDRRALVAGKAFGSGRDHEAIGRRHHLDQPLAAAEIQAVVVVDLAVLRALAGIDVARLVGHLRRAGEPPLLERIDHRPGVRQRRPLRPKAEPGITHQTPGLGAGVGKVALGDRAVDLHAGNRPGQFVVGRREPGFLTVHFDVHAGFSDRIADRVARLYESEEPDGRLLPVGELDPLQLPEADVDGPHQRLQCRLGQFGGGAASPSKEQASDGKTLTHHGKSPQC